jgi:hypothetical protein
MSYWTLLQRVFQLDQSSSLNEQTRCFGQDIRPRGQLTDRTRYKNISTLTVLCTSNEAALSVLAKTMVWRTFEAAASIQPSILTETKLAD